MDRRVAASLQRHMSIEWAQLAFDGSWWTQNPFFLHENP